MHQVARGANAVKLGVDVLKQARAGGPAFGRRRHDHRVAALERVDDFVGRCGRRVGGRRNGANHAHRAGDLGNAGGRVLVDHAHRFGALQVAQQAKGLAVVFAHLVGHVADAGVGHGQLGQSLVARGLDDGPAGRGHQLVHAGLVVAVGNVLGGAGARHQGVHHSLGF